MSYAIENERKKERKNERDMFVFCRMATSISGIIQS